MLVSKHRRLGATGEFPQGKVHDSDEGELTIAVGREMGVVVLRFGKPVAWIGMDPGAARGLAALLVKHADAIEQ